MQDTPGCCAVLLSQSYLPLFSIIQSRLQSVSDSKNIPPAFSSEPCFCFSHVLKCPTLTFLSKLYLNLEPILQWHFLLDFLWSNWPVLIYPSPKCLQCQDYSTHQIYIWIEMFKNSFDLFNHKLPKDRNWIMSRHSVNICWITLMNLALISIHNQKPGW